MVDDSASQDLDSDACRAPAELDEDAATARLLAELETSLSAGFVPNGWTHRYSWEPRSPRRMAGTIGAGIVVVFMSGIAGWLIWGWKSGLAAGVGAVGLVMLLSIRGGPRPGDTITEWFVPEDEILLELGIAGHELIKLSRSRPEFSRTREATRADRRNIGRIRVAVGASFAYCGGMSLLVEAGQLSPAAALKMAALVSAVICAGVTGWYWRLIGRYIAAGATNDEPEKSLVNELLDTATSGAASTETLASGLMSRLPIRAARIVGSAAILLTGTLGVLLAFALAPHATGLWSSALAGADLIAFAVAGLRALLLIVIGLLRAEGRALWAGLRDCVLMGALLLIAKLFGWLDDWAVVIAWVGSWLS